MVTSTSFMILAGVEAPAVIPTFFQPSLVAQEAPVPSQLNM
ncbi:MAG: hypothetical protein V8Q17_02805 [Acutalibacteraceae bacterium]